LRWHAIRIAIAVMVCAGMLAAPVRAPALTGFTPRWAHLLPPASPPPGFGDLMAYDAATRQLVLLDGTNGETWIWNGTTWTPVPLPVGAARPPARVDAMMAYDAQSRQLILFGGNTSQGSPLDDTWDWTGTGWARLSPASSPPPTNSAAMAYDPNSQRLILFGGLKNFSEVTADTWAWNGSDWSQLSPDAFILPRYGAAMAYDPGSKQLVMFGGLYQSFFLPETWGWNGTNWVELAPTTSPTPRFFAAMAYDSTTNELLLAGGGNFSFLASGGIVSRNFNDTWKWSGSNWVQQAPATRFTPARLGPALADDPDTRQLVLFGGFSGQLGDTWVWTPPAVQTATLPAGAVGARYSSTLQAVAGTAPYTWSVAFGALPAGLTLSSTGVITGIPTTAGSFTFTVRADDSTASPQPALRQLTLTVNPAPQPAVWVGNEGNSDVNAFGLTATGNAMPQATLSGALTGLNAIGGLAFDAAGQLWVASSGNDAIEQFAPGAHGNVAPSRVVAGPDTGLSNPGGLAFDARGRIYVTNGTAQSITVYPPDASGNTPPQRTISGPATGLSTPKGITLDRPGHIWVANFGSDTLTEYAANANRDAAPIATISGGATQLAHPLGLGQDSAGNLLVANFFGRSVLTFANAAPLGNVAPVATVSGAQSQLNSPQSVDVDTARRTYVADSQVGLLVFARGSSTPATVLTGPATGIKAPGSVAVAPPLEVTTDSLPRAALGRRYSGRLMAILGKAPLRWHRVRGRLPRALKLARNGRVTGTPHKTGRYHFTVLVRDSERRRQSAQARITLNVARAPAVTSLSRTRGSRRGGRTMTITGTGFSTARHGTTVSYGRIRAPRVRCRSRVRCTVRTPPGKLGTVPVTVTVGGLTSSASRHARYRYTR
jgi:sugar lactone lactonase YvrE